MKKLALIIGLLAAASCVAPKHLLPTIRMSWPGVMADIQRGAAVVGQESTQALVDKMTSALASDELDASLAVWWKELQPLAVAGVADRIAQGEINEDAATLLYQRIDNFRTALLMLLGSGSSVLGPLPRLTLFRGVHGWCAGSVVHREALHNPRFFYEYPRRRLGVPIK